MPDPVLNYLKARARDGHAGRDGRRIALVIEGGGMRGVYLAGMLRALKRNGIGPEHFDMIVGSSVGVYLACYYAAGKSDLAEDILLTDALDRRFIDVGRIFTGGPVLNNTWMIDDVFYNRKPFGSLAGVSHLYAVCTGVPDAIPEVFKLDTDEHRTRAILRATGAIPFIAGPAVPVGGRLYVDGGISDQIPIESAERLGATDILVLMTRRRSSMRKGRLTVNHLFEEAALLKLYGSKVAALYRQRGIRINQGLDDLDKGVTAAGTSVEGVFVADQAPKIGRLTKDHKRLEAAAESCFRDLNQRISAIRDGR